MTAAPASMAPPAPKSNGLETIAALPMSNLVEQLGTDVETGLSSADARERLARFGANDPAPITRPGWTAILLRQFASKLILLLVIATVVSGALGEWINAAAIGVTVIVSAGFGFFNELRSENAIAALHQLTALRAEVVRDGLHEEISAAEIVPGDLVVVSEGRSVPADARVVEARGLFANESILTGEPMAVAKAAENDSHGDSATPANALYAGTTVVAGSGLALVVATGASTSLGGIFTAMRDARRRATPLEERLEGLGNRLIAIFLSLCVALVVIGLFQGRELRIIIQMAVALAVGAIPEGLPAVATTTLAVAVRRLAGRKVLVRRLDAVETLGSTTIIATDKTGTLTENRMVVRRVLLADGRAFRIVVQVHASSIDTTIDPSGTGHVTADDRAAIDRLLLVAALCNDAVVEHDDDRGWHAHGDPSEGAIALAAAGLGHDTDRLESVYPRIETEPFSSTTRVMRTVHRIAGSPESITAIKGAPEQVAELVGSAHPALTAAVHELADEGYRVLAVAEGRDDTPPRLLGAVVLEDPLRPDAAAAVEACHSAGIRLMLITGDQARTAANVARETGILAEGQSVVLGADLDVAGLSNVAVVARATHGNKEAIIAALQDQGHVVAMTGDGVNDAPALRAADVGVAIGPGATDVAMEAADIVVADGRLFSLVEGIREGRQIAQNLRQAIVYLLTASFGTILLITLSMGASDELALGPLQILWLNLVVHIFPALALSIGREESASTSQPTGDLFTGRTWTEIAVRALTVALGGLAALLISVGWDESPGHTQAMVFASLAFGLVGQAFLIDVHSLRGFRARVSRLGLWIGEAISGVLLMAAMHLPGFRSTLGLEPISAMDWAVVVACAAGAWLAAQLVLAIPRRSMLARPGNAATN